MAGVIYGGGQVLVSRLWLLCAWPSVSKMLKRQGHRPQTPAVKPGSAPTLCSGKTGTLAENMIEVEKIFSGLLWILTGQAPLEGRYWVPGLPLRGCSPSRGLRGQDVLRR